MSLKILYYISGHGYGHAVRSIQVIKALMAFGCRVSIKTTAPAFLFDEGLSGPTEILTEGFDAGLHQIDNIRFDLDKTKENMKKILASAPGLIEKEQKFLTGEAIAGVVSDIPFIPLAAAAGLRIPSIGLGNFSWDWVYAYYGKKDPEWKAIAETIATYYRKADLLLRLPFYGSMEVFQRIEDIPLIGRRSNKERTEIQKALDLPRDRRIGLIGFSQVDLNAAAVENIEKLSSSYLFLVRPPLNWQSPALKRIGPESASFVDLIRAVDFVITKPGYGIVADCLSDGTPMIYSDRGDFPEYPILVEGIETHLSCCYMPKEDLYAGTWGPYLERLNQPSRPKPKFKTDGAQVAAERIVKWIEAGRVHRLGARETKRL
jgi:hypothetical protein